MKLMSHGHQPRKVQYDISHHHHHHHHHDITIIITFAKLISIVSDSKVISLIADISISTSSITPHDS